MKFRFNIGDSVKLYPKNTTSGYVIYKVTKRKSKSVYICSSTYPQSNCWPTMNQRDFEDYLGIFTYTKVNHHMTKLGKILYK